MYDIPPFQYLSNAFACSSVVTLPTSGPFHHIYNTSHLKRNSVVCYYIPLAHVGNHIRSAILPVGSARLFGYQHAGIGNAKRLHWCLYPTRSANANRFAFWWNIGLKLAFPPPNHRLFNPTKLPILNNRSLTLKWSERSTLAHINSHQLTSQRAL